MRTYFTGNATSSSKTTLQMLQPFSASEINFFAARYDDNGNVASVFKDANQREEGTYWNEWNPGKGMTIGARIAVKNSATEYPWYGEVYAIRLYNRRLTKAELARNHRIDCKRFLTSASYIQEGLPRTGTASTMSEGDSTTRLRTSGRISPALVAPMT